MLWYFLLQVGPPGASRCGLLFMWINTHTLSNSAFNISPFFAGSLYASPNAHDAFFFSFTEIVYQTHCISSFPATARTGRTWSNWCDADGRRLETAAGLFDFVASLQTA